MKRQCSTCGGSMAHYASVPPGYCVTHSEWFTSFNKCSSNIFSNCSDVYEDDGDFGYICPVDGFRIQSSIDISQRGSVHRIISFGHPELDSADLMEILGSSAGGGYWDRHRSACKPCSEAFDKYQQTGEMPDEAPSASLDPNDSSSTGAAPLTPVNPDDIVEDLGGKKMVKGQGGGFASVASVQKTAMWYYLKPRWIIRRKVQAAVRRKVRSLLTPIAIKSSSVQDEE